VTRFGQRTYWHLLELGRVPSTYDVASSNLHYYPRLGFSVRTPIADWYRRHQSESPFQADDWERFRDPRATTYRSYVALQRDQEAYVEGVLRHAHRGSTDAEPEWLDGLARTLA
jgi:toluene monooxygenase system protein E